MEFLVNVFEVKIVYIQQRVEIFLGANSFEERFSAQLKFGKKISWALSPFEENLELHVVR